MKLLFAGEGPTELGDWAGHPAYHPSDGAVDSGGVLHAMVRHFVSDYETGAVATWKSVRKFRVGNHEAPETRTVVGLALQAYEAGCDVLVFSRDRDRDQARETDVERGIASALERFPDVAIVGGTANEQIEAWLLAMKGDSRCEQYADPKQRLTHVHHVRNRAEKIRVVEAADLDSLPVPSGNAASLIRWCQRASSAWRRAPSPE